ncbi:hypothetical protein J1614_011524 [Plenodomus biglobosus]|nr:hypothetical protein J1614_011524 [Plenodomus biglobosus]
MEGEVLEPVSYFLPLSPIGYPSLPMVCILTTSHPSKAIEKKATNYGSSISGQTYQPSPKALPSTARKPVVKRSNSLPASSTLANSGTKAIPLTPLGGKRYPGTNQANGSAIKAVTGGGISRAKSTTSSSTTRASKGIPNTATGSRQKALPRATTTSSSFTTKKTPPTPTYTPTKPPPPNNPNTTIFPRAPPPTTPKTAVKPFAPKPFVAPVAHSKTADAKPRPYPGTNTLPGQASKTPVSAPQKKKMMKPVPRLGPQVQAGQKMMHIAI